MPSYEQILSAKEVDQVITYFKRPLSLVVLNPYG